MINNMLSIAWDYLIDPFVQYTFLKRALVASCGIALTSGPVGVILVLKRMSLMGDALSHGILPGIAIGYLVAGLWLPALTIGGIIAGLAVALISGFISRHTNLYEDASFTGLYLISLAIGVLILSAQGGNMNLMHLLFGSVLGIDQTSLLIIALSTTFSLLTLALVYRPLIYECFDPLFLQAMGVKGGYYNLIFLAIVVCNLVAACQALGTLMALGIMMLPAIAARVAFQSLPAIFLASTLIATFSGYVGLILSYHLNWLSGPTIILVCGCFYIVALLKRTFSQRL